jgi:DNA-binding NarL/FixJ family response regulator
VQVLAGASEGLTNDQIAERLEVTSHAVKFHLSSVYRKLGVANRTEAAVEYLRVGALSG